ncbi:toxoplasma gondii family A protein, partial [Toxoplasma gondii ARI]
MACQALRAALLAFLVAITVPGAPSEASGSETEPDFIVTIRSNGVQENTQQVFSLRPSATLRVVDESAKAFFLPQSATADQDSAPGYNFCFMYLRMVAATLKELSHTRMLSRDTPSPCGFDPHLTRTPV